MIFSMLYPHSLLKESLIVPAHFLKRLHLQSTKFTDQIITLLEKTEAEPECKMALKLLPPPLFALRLFVESVSTFPIKEIFLSIIVWD